MSRSSQFSVTISVDDRPLGVWDAMEGGEITSEETRYRPGAMGPQVSLGGSTQVENITARRLYDLARDHSQIHWLQSRAGRARCVVTKNSLDIDGNVFGSPLVYKGVLMRVAPPPADSQSDDPAMLEIEISTDGTIA